LTNNFGQIILPCGCITKFEEKQVEFHFIENNENVIEATKLLSSVIVYGNLTASVFVSAMRLQQSSYQHMLDDKKIKSFSGLTNLLARSKSLAEKSTSFNNNYIDMAVGALQDFISLQTESDNAEVNFVQLQFIIEQLQLLFESKEVGNILRLDNNCFYVAAYQYSIIQKTKNCFHFAVIKQATHLFQ